MKILLVFDFDHTLVDDNSDIWVLKCLPLQSLPASIEDSYVPRHWTEYMCRVMKHIGDQGISLDQVRGVMETMPLTDGMRELLAFVAENKSAVDCVVISDSNSLFIGWVLEAAGLRAAVDRVYTNPAEVGKSGCVEVRHHHSHLCGKCPVNMCKRRVLEQHLSERAGAGVEYRTVLYVGDGGNDLCPAYCLRARDTVMPRRGYRLEKHLAKLETERGHNRPNAKVVPWSSGTEVLQEVKASLSSA